MRPGVEEDVDSLHVRQPASIDDHRRIRKAELATQLCALGRIRWVENAGIDPVRNEMDATFVHAGAQEFHGDRLADAHERVAEASRCRKLQPAGSASRLELCDFHRAASRLRRYGRPRLAATSTSMRSTSAANGTNSNRWAPRCRLLLRAWFRCRVLCSTSAVVQGRNSCLIWTPYPLESMSDGAVSSRDDRCSAPGRHRCSSASVKRFPSPAPPSTSCSAGSPSPTSTSGWLSTTWRACSLPAACRC